MRTLILIEQAEHIRLSRLNVSFCRGNFFRPRHLVQFGKLRFRRHQIGLLNSKLSAELAIIDAEQCFAGLDFFSNVVHRHKDFQDNAGEC
jgi:hypothetical protein